MNKYNPKNERTKRKYFEYQKEANRKSTSTIDNVRKAIDRYEQFTDYADLKTFKKQKAVAFKRALAQTVRKDTGKPLSKATVNSSLRHLKDFFRWLAYQKGYRKIDVTQIEYLNLTRKEVMEARSRRLKRYPTLEQIKAALESMPANNDVEKRSKALMAFMALTGIRDGAIASLKLKHIRLDRNLVEQLPDEVNTKFSKTIYTHFFPVGDEVKQIFVDWIRYLREELLFNDDDPVFPATKMGHNENLEFEPIGLEPIHWKSAGQIRKIVNAAFGAAGIECFTPHSFRDMLVRLGEQVCRSPEEFKAWSQSLGHSSPLTTFTNYGPIDTNRQGEILEQLQSRDAEISPNEMLKRLYDRQFKDSETT